jgi:hypothetical protein
LPDQTPGADAALIAEHAALRRQTLALGRDHERMRASGSQRAQWQAHRARLRQNVTALERHYRRLRQRAAQRDRECAAFRRTNRY